MSVKRAVVVLPVLAGLTLAGTALARIAPATGADAAPACVRNGVHPNPQGHPSCGLHFGWAGQETSTETATSTDTTGETVTEPADDPAGDTATGDDATGTDEGTAGDPAAAKVCKNREVRLNKNGHPTCGLHKGWDKHEPAPSAATDTTGDTGHSHPGKNGPKTAAHPHGGGHASSHGAKHGDKPAKHSH